MHRQEKSPGNLQLLLQVCEKSVDLPYNGPGRPSQNVDHNTDQQCGHKFGCGKGGSAERFASKKYILV